MKTDIGKRIRQLRRAAKLTQEQLAERMSMESNEKITRGAVGNWELGGGISTENLLALARIFNASVEWIADGVGSPHIQQIEPKQVHSVLTGKPLDESLIHKTSLGERAPHETNARLGGSVAIDHMVKAYGHAMGGKDGEFVLNGNEITEILAPASLRGVPDAYAVFVAGDSMEPRYFAGEAVFVNPRLPVRKGDFVVAQIMGREGEPPLAYIKRFVSMNDKLRLSQYNPEKFLTFDRAKVVSVHRIITWGG